MSVEIERKFLVAGTGWRSAVVRRSELRQGYLDRSDKVSIRVRVRDGVRAALTIKSASPGMTRDEFEYDIPVADAERLFPLCAGALIEKVRHEVRQGDLMWEIDVFGGDNAGLTVAEIELPSENTPFDRPAWLGEEVTEERRYYNSALVAHPYKDWSDA